MIIVVNDTNILIDLIELDLTEVFFSINWVFYTTDMIIETELNDEKQRARLRPFIDSGTLKIKEFDHIEMLEILQVHTDKPQLSVQDCSAFIGAKTLSAHLLTSDNKLRKYAESKEIEVHGHLWVFDALVELNLITPTTAILKLEELETINKKLKLPIEECKIRIKRWRNLNK